MRRILASSSAPTTPPPIQNYGAVPPTGGIVSGSTVVKNATDFQNALNNHVLDITLDAVVNAPSSGFVIPRLANTVTVRGTEGALIQRTSTGGACISAGSGTGGSFILDHIRCDGGWRNAKSLGNGSDIPFKFNSCDYVSFRNCISCYSRDLAMVFNDTTQAEVLNCTLFCICTGAFSDDNVRDLLVQDCWMQHGGDDSIQWHQFNQPLRTCSIILRHNLIRDYFGGKCHCSVLDGTFNGKPSQSLWENNFFEGANRYGTEFNNSPSSGGVKGPPHNFIWQNNTVKNLIKDSPSVRSGSPVGVCMNFAALLSGNSFDSTTTIKNNKFIRDTSIQGLHNQDVYTWAQVGGADKPAWVPGSDAQGGGYWSQTGFVSSWQIDLASKAIVLDGDNPGAVTHSGNSYVGDGWTNTLT